MEDTKADPAKRFCWSLDEERFHGDFASRRDAIIDAIGGNPPEEGYARTVWTGVVAKLDVAKLVRGCGMYLLDHIGDGAYDVAGGVAEDWLRNVKPEELEKLDDMIAACLGSWITVFGHKPNFWVVDEITSHTIDHHYKEVC